MVPVVSVPGYNPTYFEFDRPELLALIPTYARDVIDVGCGAGRLGQSLKARQQCRVVGIEQNPAAAAVARTRLDHVLEANAETIDWPYPPHSFDAIICGDVLEHLRDPLAFLHKARNWLRADGVVVASLLNVRHHSIIRGLLRGDWTYEPSGLLDQAHLRFFTRREIEKLFFRAGLTVPKLIPLPGAGYSQWQAAGRPGEVSIGALRISPLQPADVEEFYTYQWIAAAPVLPASNHGLTSIVILTHNLLSLTRRCIASIQLVTDEPYELVIVDNGSTDGTAEYLQALAEVDVRVKVVLNRDNRGFPSGCNQGIEISQGEQVLLLNNDTVATTGWLGRMLRALHSDAAIGLVGPCSNQVSGGQQIPVRYSRRDLSGLDGFAWEWGRANDKQIEETDRLIGFCLLIKRVVIDTIGLLDEGFGIGNFEDDDYCLRAFHAGYKAVIARDAFIHHVGGATFDSVNVDFPALMRQNASRFREKWGDDPPAHAPTPVAISPVPTVSSSDRATPLVDPEPSNVIRTVNHPRVLFVSYHCFHDPSSGAALCTRDLFDLLTQRGWACGAVTGAFLDSDRATPIGSILAGQVDVQILRERAGDLSYTVYHSTADGYPVSVFAPDPPAVQRAPSPIEAHAFGQIVDRVVRQIQPDVVLTYGGDPASAGVIDIVRRAGAKVVFWLHNLAYTSGECFRACDAVIVPSEFSRNYYRSALGIESVVLPGPFAPARFLCDSHEAQFVTFVNPEPTKGVFWFARLAEVLGKTRPDIPLLVVEGRSGIDWLGHCGVDLSTVRSMHSVHDELRHP